MKVAGESYTNPSGFTTTVPLYTDPADAPVAFKDFADSLGNPSQGGIDLTSERDAQLIQGDGSGGWDTGMVLKVVQDLPADDDPNYAIGDAVFVLGDVDPKGELPGIGGWADITGVTGTGTKYEYTADGMEWSTFEWNQDGNVTTSEGGLVAALIIGSGGSSSGSYAGTAGCLIYGVDLLGTSEAIIVGQKLTTGTVTQGNRSALGTISAGGGNAVGNGKSPNGFQSTAVSGWGAGAGSTGDAVDRDLGGPGLTVSITGTPVTYGEGGGIVRTPEERETLGPGSGSDRGNDAKTYQHHATSGVVIIRVPRKNDKTGLPAGPFDTLTAREKAAMTAERKKKEKEAEEKAEQMRAEEQAAKEGDTV